MKGVRRSGGEVSMIIQPEFTSQAKAKKIAMILMLAAIQA